MKKSTFAVLLFLMGCATGPSYELAQKSQFIDANYQAADRVGSALRSQNFMGPLLISTIVSVDNLRVTSRLGRSISEQIGSRLAQVGFAVIEVKLRENIFVSDVNQGEFLLSRELKDISAAHKASGVVVGTYAVAGDYVYVTMKVIDLQSSQIIASTDYTLPVVGTVRMMLKERF